MGFFPAPLYSGQAAPGWQHRVEVGKARVPGAPLGTSWDLELGQGKKGALTAVVMGVMGQVEAELSVPGRVCIQVYMGGVGVHGCAYGCTRVYMGVFGGAYSCAQLYVCMGVQGCVYRCVHECARVCVQV